MESVLFEVQAEDLWYGNAFTDYIMASVMVSIIADR